MNDRGAELVSHARRDVEHRRHRGDVHNRDHANDNAGQRERPFLKKVGATSSLSQDTCHRNYSECSTTFGPALKSPAFPAFFFAVSEAAKSVSSNLCHLAPEPMLHPRCRSADNRLWRSTETFVCDQPGCTLVLRALLQSVEKRGYCLQGSPVHTSVWRGSSLLWAQPLAISPARADRKSAPTQTASPRDCLRFPAQE